MRTPAMEIENHLPHELDDETATLILQLQSRDIEELMSVNKGKSRDGDVSDADLAVATYQQELQTMNVILADRCMGRSLTRAVVSDAALLNESLAEENAAARDRVLAHSLAQVSGPPVAPEQTTAAYDLDDGYLARLAAIYGSGWNNDSDALEDNVSSGDPAAAESSASATSRKRTPSTTHRHCIACDLTKPLFDVCRTPCGHFYCQECIQTIFELSATDETLFPPRCCRETIPLQSVKIYLSSAVVQTFEEKSIAFKTSNRTYCSLPACSSFIAADKINGERAMCGKCGTQTCAICKKIAHDGDCPQDIATQQVLETAREHGWQKCYSCGRLVELDVGCNHITCLCKAEFCYVCGERWKTCHCEQWNENRLLARANQIVARNQPPRGLARERAYLRERHNCVHDNGVWQYHGGPYQCEECHDHIREHIFKCELCGIIICGARKELHHPTSGLLQAKSRDSSTKAFISGEVL